MDREIKHGVVYGETGVYAAWPANHGAWQWGDEFLVGFIRGKYGNASMHNVVGPLEKMQARSLDGGETWCVEKPNVDFEAAWATDSPAFCLDNSIIRCCGVYDHGGEDCNEAGGFYLSHDKGKTWEGAYSFKGLEKEFSAPFCNTSRTAVLGDLVFLSANYQGHFGTDHTLVARHAGDRFELISVVDDEKGRIVMPAPVRICKTIIFAARRRGESRRDCWIDAYASHDEGLTWANIGMVGDTGTHNGSPPALIESNGKLVCAFANRSDCAICISVSEDMGNTWSPRQPIREGGNSDIGYPRLFKRSDGKLVCVYYWADQENKFQRIAWTEFDA